MNFTSKVLLIWSKKTHYQKNKLRESNSNDFKLAPYLLVVLNSLSSIEYFKVFSITIPFILSFLKGFSIHSYY